MSTDTLPPHDPLTEAAALGTVLDSNGDSPDLLKALVLDDFYDRRHRTLFPLLQSLHAQHQPLNSVSAYIILTEKNLLDEAGGLDYVQRLPDQSAGTATFPLLLDTLHSYSARRAALSDSALVADLARDPSVTTTALASASERLLSTQAARAPSSLPEMLDAATFSHEDLPKPLELISGLLHQGSKLALGGGSKSFKSWTLLDLAIAVAYGLPWLRFETTAAPVLYINFEIPPWSWQHRLKTICAARAITQIPGRLTLWNLRGFATNYSTLLPKILAIAKNRFALIIIDPIYKLYGQADENSASDIAALLNALDFLITQTQAALAWGSHFSKGNQSAKDSIDRVSGSGVFARDPDSLIMFTKHEIDDAFTVESTLRNFPPVPPFVVKWNYPALTLAQDLDPARLKKAGGRPLSASPDSITNLIANTPMSTSDWQKSAYQELGVSRSAFHRLKLDLLSRKRVSQSSIDGRWFPLK